jgi:hypothetical protein
LQHYTHRGVLEDGTKIKPLLQKDQVCRQSSRTMSCVVDSFYITKSANIKVATYLSSGSEIEKQSQVDKPVIRLPAQ